MDLSLTNVCLDRGSNPVLQHARRMLATSTPPRRLKLFTWLKWKCNVRIFQNIYLKIWCVFEYFLFHVKLINLSWTPFCSYILRAWINVRVYKLRFIKVIRLLQFFKSLFELTYVFTNWGLLGWFVYYSFLNRFLIFFINIILCKMHASIKLQTIKEKL